MKESNWDSDLLCSRIKQEVYNQGFEKNPLIYKLVHADKDISVNEFITLLKQTLFADDDSVKLEDIWLFSLDHT